MRANASRRQPAPGFDMLNSLNAQGKVLSSWILDLVIPSTYLTLAGANVTGWTAALGLQKVNLAELTNPPQWDATLFSNKGGVTFDGVAQVLNGPFNTGNVLNWPGSAEQYGIVVACRNDFAADGSGLLKAAFGYGGGNIISPRSRAAGITLQATTIPSAFFCSSGLSVGANNVSGAAVLSIFSVPGGATTVYVNGVSAIVLANPSQLIATPQASMGSIIGGNFWKGPVACAAVLGPTVTEVDVLALSAEFGARVV